jgi:hypothetical protein
MPLGRRMLSRGGRQNGIMYVYMPAGLPEPFYAQTLLAVRLVDRVHDLFCRSSFFNSESPLCPPHRLAQRSIGRVSKRMLQKSKTRGRILLVHAINLLIAGSN